MPQAFAGYTHGPNINPFIPRKWTYVNPRSIFSVAVSRGFAVPHSRLTPGLPVLASSRFRPVVAGDAAGFAPYILCHNTCRM